MPHLRVQQMQVIPQRLGFEIGAYGAVELCVAAAHFEVHLIDVLHELYCLFASGMAEQITAEAVGDVVLAVGHTSRAAEAVHYRAGLTVYAGLDLLSVYRTDALRNGSAPVDDADARRRVQLSELIRHENAACACPYDYNIVFRHIVPHMKISAISGWVLFSRSGRKVSEFTKQCSERPVTCSFPVSLSITSYDTLSRSPSKSSIFPRIRTG